MPKPDHIDNETWRIMVEYCGGDAYAPRLLKEELLNVWYGEEWSLIEFKRLIDEALARVPPELQDTARVVFEGGDYDNSGQFEIFHLRLETTIEQAARVQDAIQYARNRQAEELASYERLKTKFDQR